MSDPNKKLPSFGQLGQGPRVETQYDINEIPTLRLKSFQAVNGSDRNVYLIFIREDGGAFKIPLDARSAKGLALIVTQNALMMEPETPSGVLKLGK